MTPAASFASPDKWQPFVKYGAIALIFVLVPLLGTIDPFLPLALPALWLIAIACTRLAFNPRLFLALVLCTYVTIIGYTTERNVLHLFYGVLLVSYLAHWYVARLFVFREPILLTRTDYAVGSFILFATFTFTLSLFQADELASAFSEFVPLLFLALYFPIKEVVARYDNGIRIVILSVLAIGCFVLIRNIILYLDIISQADALWRVMTGRVRMNERFLLAVTFGCVVLLLNSTSWRRRLVSIAGVLLFFPGIVIGQSRGLWIGAVLAFITLLLLITPKQRVAIVGYMFVSLLGMFAIASFLFGDLFTLISAGLTERVVSLQTAVTADMSLVNRFAEWHAALAKAVTSPFIGHGFGVQYSFFDLTFQSTHTKSHIHSMFVGVFYRHGLIGFGLMMMFLGSFIHSALNTHREGRYSNSQRQVSLICMTVLITVLTQGTMESLMIVTDGTILIALCGGVIMGIRQRGSGNRNATQS